MDTANSNGHRFSSDVRMHLRVNGQVLSIGQLGPDFIILDDATDLPPSEAEVSISIDGRAKRWIVHLPNGIAVGMAKTKIARIE